jgi:MFS family permease
MIQNNEFNDVAVNNISYPKYRWFVLFSACFAIATIYIHMTSIAPILGIIANDLDIGMGQATQLFTSRMLGEAVWMVILGFVVDKYGLTTSLLLGNAIGLLSVVVTPWIGDSYLGFLTVRFMQAGAVGMIFPVIGYVAAHWFPQKEHGLANGLFFGALGVGAGVGALMSPLINEAIQNWQLTVAILGIFNVIGMALALMLIGKKGPLQDEKIDESAPEIVGGMTYREALTHPVSWLGAFIVFANAWIMFNSTNIIPAFLAEPKPMGAGLGAVTSGYLNLALTWIGVPAVLIGGWFYDSLLKGRAKVAVFIGFICAMFAFMLIYPSIQANMFLLVVILMVVGFGMPFQNASISSYIVKVYPSEVSGQMIGWWFGFGTFGAAAGLFLGSISIDKTDSFNLSIIMIALAAVAGFILTFFLNDDKRVQAKGL